jgi:hypothetical protein
MIVTLSKGSGNGHALKFIPIIGAFDRLHLVTGKSPYSSMLYHEATENGTNRRASNVKAIGNVFILDIDDGMTLHDAIETAGSYRSLIVTSKSHQIEKKGKVNDRFRVLIPLYSKDRLHLSIPKEDYSGFYSFTAQYLGFNSFDKATKDIARFYYPNPLQEVHYSLSDEVLEFETLYGEYLDHKKLSEAFKRPYTPRTSSGERDHLLKNELPRNQVFETKNGGAISWNNAGAKPIPVKCVFTENHKHGDQNPSAFIVHDGDKESPRFYCTGCGASCWMGAV